MLNVLIFFEDFLSNIFYNHVCLFSLVDNLISIYCSEIIMVCY